MIDFFHFALIAIILFLHQNKRIQVREAIKEGERLKSKEIGQYISDNAHLFKQPSTSNALYLVGMYYLKNGECIMPKVANEVFELGLNKLTEEKHILTNRSKGSDWNPDETINPNLPKMKDPPAPPAQMTKNMITEFGPK